MTALVHGPEEAAAAEQAAAILFGAPLEDATPGALGAVVAEVGATPLPRSRLEEGAGLEDLLVETGLAASRSDARRTLAQGAAYVNNRRAGEDRAVTGADLLHGRYVLLRRGKKQYHALIVG
jgi:tyrosyl-tRNA synthetase